MKIQLPGRNKKISKDAINTILSVVHGEDIFYTAKLAQDLLEKEMSTVQVAENKALISLDSATERYNQTVRERKQIETETNLIKNL